MVLTPNRSYALSPFRGATPANTVSAAGTYVSEPVHMPPEIVMVAIRSQMVYGSGGTTAKVFLQTTIDGGLTWMDVACLAFALANATKMSAVHNPAATTAALVPTDGTLTDDTIKDGIIGDWVRVKVVVVGTYVGTTLTADVVAS